MTDFAQMIRSVNQGERVAPVIRSMLHDPAYAPFTIEMPGMGGRHARKIDGWFHPSVHPLWSPLQLSWYYQFPERFVRETLTSTSTMAITAGNFWHRYFQHLLLEAKLLIPNDGTHCGECKKNPAEHFVICEETHSCGHCDGDLGDDLVEFKTFSKAYRFSELPNDASVIAQEYPVYYAQAMDYLRMMGRPGTVLVMVSPAYPFDVREYYLPYEKIIGNRIREKYLAAMQGDQPEWCCGQMSDESLVCPMRDVCPRGTKTMDGMMAL